MSTALRYPCNLRRRNHQRQSGYVLIMATISIVVLIGFVGLAIDIAYLEHVKRRMQTAADSAALSGAWELNRFSTDPDVNDKIKTAAFADAKSNGFENGGNIAITVNPTDGPVTGLYAGTPAVEVIIRQTNQPMFFIQVLAGNSPGTVAARAVAHLAAGNGCMYALSPNDKSSLTLSGNETFNVPDCAIMVNSQANPAVKCNGNGTINVQIGAVGPVDCPQANPPAVGGLLPASDPLKNLPSPIPVGFNHWTNKNPTCDAAHTKVTINNAATLSPGVYCNGISISTGANVTFEPGMYIIDGGGLTMTGGTALGSGVTFFLTGTDQTYAPITMNGGVFGTAEHVFTAPSEGDYKSVLFYGDRSINPNQSQFWNTINGNISAAFNGVIYFATGGVELGGTGDMAATNTSVVSHEIKVAGNPGFSGDVAALPGGAPIHLAVLGE